jgi:hypothetical protein
MAREELKWQNIDADDPGADAVSSAEDDTNRRIIASAWSTRRGRENLACAEAPYTRTGRSHVWPAAAYGIGALSLQKRPVPGLAARAFSDDCHWYPVRPIEKPRLNSPRI